MPQRDAMCPNAVNSINLNNGIPPLCNQIPAFQRGPACAAGALNFNVVPIQPQQSPCGGGCSGNGGNLPLQQPGFAPFQQMPINIHNIPHNTFPINQNPNTFTIPNNNNNNMGGPGFLSNNNNNNNCGGNCNDGCGNGCMIGGGNGAGPNGCQPCDGQSGCMGNRRRRRNALRFHSDKNSNATREEFKPSTILNTTRIEASI